MQRYVMFGHSNLFGDYVETVHALGGYVGKVVVNVPDPDANSKKSFADRLQNYCEWVGRQGQHLSPVIEQLDDFRPVPGDHYFVGFRGSQITPLCERLKQQYELPIASLIHPSAVVSPTATLGEGVIVNANATVASGASLGDFVLVNRGATLGHDTRLATFTSIGPGANLASFVETGDGSIVGIGATVIEHISLGAGCYVAAGAVVIHDVEPHALVAGVPAKLKK